MADMNVTNQETQALSHLKDKLSDYINGICDAEALLICAEESLWEKPGVAEYVRRVVSIARGRIADIREQIDQAQLDMGASIKRIESAA